MNILQEKSTVIVIFAGLMVFHYYQADHYFKVGILQHAPHHVFQVYGPSTKKVLSRKTPVRRRLSSAWPEEMDLEVIRANGTHTTEATPYQVGDGSPRMDSRNPEDYRYVASFDELYPAGHYIRNRSLGPAIHLRAGELFTLCRTDFLLSKKDSHTPKDFGYMADLMGLRMELKENEKLVLTGTTLEVEYKPGVEQYVVIANIPPPEYRCPNADHCKDFDTHFQHYYSAVAATLFYEKYDFGYKDGRPKDCNPSMPPKIVEYLRKVNIITKSPYSDREDKFTPPPYFCGIASSSEEWVTGAQRSPSQQQPLSKKR